jgi:hypothetical protein
MPYPTLRIATGSKPVCRLSGEQARGGRAQLGKARVELLEDISLDVSRWLALKNTWYPHTVQ